MSGTRALAVSNVPESPLLGTASLAAVWALTALLTWIALYSSLSVWEHWWLGSNYVLPVGYAWDQLPTPLRFGVALWSVPVLSIVAVFVLRWGTTLVAVSRARLSSVQPAQERVGAISRYAGVRPPFLLLQHSNFVDAAARRFLGAGSVVTITDKAIAELEEDELEALIAHEVWHIKAHSRLTTLVAVASTWTFYGKGFLMATMNVRAMEHSADDFSLEWLQVSGHREPAVAVRRMLEKVRVYGSLARYVESSRSRSPPAGAPARPQRLHDLAMSLRLLYKLYFGDAVLSYLHPAIDERIGRLGRRPNDRKGGC